MFLTVSYCEPYSPFCARCDSCLLDHRMLRQHHSQALFIKEVKPRRMCFLESILESKNERQVDSYNAK